MNFTRKKLRGQNQRVRKTWLSEEQYRVVWRSEAFGIAVLPAFQASVRIMLPNGSEMWDFVSKPLFKTQKAAQDACEKHYRLWTKAAEASGVRKLEELFGKVPSGYPLWVRSKLNRNVYGLLMDTNTKKRKDIEICDLDPAALTRISASIVGPAEATETDQADDDTLASSVEDEDSTPTPSTKTTKSSAPVATEPEKAPKKRAAKPMRKRSSNTPKRKQTTTALSASAKKPSPSSPKKKSKRSKS